MMARVAAIDVGTNSVKVSVADVTAESGVTIVREDAELTRLGKGVDETKVLSDDAMARTLAAIKRFADGATADGAGKIVIVGTSALRDAGNGQAFIDAVHEATGIGLEIIAGEREAQLAYRAVRFDPSLGLPPDCAVAVFDIGGGSTEINIGTGSTLTTHESLNIGAVRITERIIHSDPPTASELADARKWADEMLRRVPSPSGRLVAAGIGGTVVNIAGIVCEGKYDAHAAMIPADEIEGTLTRLASMSLAERKLLPGLEVARADVIVGGAIILAAVVTHLGVGGVRVSKRGLRYGILHELGS
ncbi:MAG TPA: Ppx/GppA phosphatase family protein [Capsulimonadaceae bacterium]|jgi:exopolyphosphatase/guanosine-5'-triphosphate,3'-diphosphate pyrophosphatase